MEGSQTAEKLGISERQLNMRGAIKHGIIKAIKEQTNQQYTDIAKMLTDPQYLSNLMSKGRK